MVRESLHLSTILPTVMKRHFHMHLVSDSTGETLQTAARAAMASYTDHSPIPHIHALIRTPRQLAKTFADIESQPGIVFFTLLDPEIRRQLEEQCQQIGVPAVSILDPMIQSLGVFLNSKSRPQVGGQYVLNADYFRRTHPDKAEALAESVMTGLSGMSAAAREGAGAGRVVGVVQPHRFTRLRDHMDDFQQAFNDADMVLALPVYAAGESPIEGVSSDTLVAGLRDRGHRHASTVADAAALAENVAGGIKAGSLRGGDMVICLGAGDITKMAAGLAAAVAAA